MVTGIDVEPVPPPTGVLPGSSYASQYGAEQLLDNGYARLAGAFAQDGFSGGGLVEFSGLLSDEFQWAFFSQGAAFANIDARRSAAFGGYTESADQSIQSLIRTRPPRTGYRQIVALTS